MKVYIGIDWSEQKHAVCFMNAAGSVIQELEIAHTPEGFLRLEQARRELGAAVEEASIGLETAHNLLTDFLVEQGYPKVYVLPPSLVKSNQSRYTNSGAKDDRRDARLIADILRTDQNRLSLWQPNTTLTRQMRAKVSLIIFLTHSIVRHTNRLRAVLLRYYPAGLVVFAQVDTPMALAFLQAYPNAQAAAQLSYRDFASFARQHHHTRPAEWPKCYARLTQPLPSASPEVVQTYQPEALLLVELLVASLHAKQQALRELQQLYQQHPDRPIFESLPAAGELLEPALLAKLGDVRERFPSPATLQAIAGTSPYTKKSGKKRSTHFRFACDRELRYLAQQWAAASLRRCPWAVSYYRQAYQHCGSKKAALRRLANRWLSVLWKLWQTHTLYDEQYHLQQRALRAKPRG
jgi:transposase